MVRLVLLVIVEQRVRPGPLERPVLRVQLASGRRVEPERLVLPATAARPVRQVRQVRQVLPVQPGLRA